jgi:hypothetical protein
MCCTFHTIESLLLPLQQQKDAEDTLEAISEQLDAIVIATASPEETAFVVGMAAAYRLGHAVTGTTNTNNESDTTSSTTSTGNGQVSANCNILHYIHSYILYTPHSIASACACISVFVTSTVNVKDQPYNCLAH